MQETTTTAAAAPVMEEEEWYVKVGSRFFRVKQPRDGGAGAMEYCRRLHYLDSCFLCKKTIDRNRDIFMYKYDLTLSCTVININLWCSSARPYTWLRRGDSAFCSEDCREDQADMDEALQAVARRHRLLRTPPPPSSQQREEAPVMRRRPTIANLAARNPPVTAS
jgi:hypothetical protein